MSYRSQLQIKFHPGAFATKNPNADRTNLPLELSFINGKPASPIASLVLHSLRSHLATIQQSNVAPKQLLHFVSSAWDRALGLENEARMLEFCGVTRLTLSGPTEASSCLRARCTLLSKAAVSSTPGRKGAAKNNGAKRIDVDFIVRTHIVPEDSKDIGSLDFDIDVLATKVYGFGSGNKSGLSDKEMQGILDKGLERQDGDAQLGNGVWCKAVRILTGSVF